MGGRELSADHAWHTLRRYHLGRLVAAAFLRFRYGDGFSHARAFALQLALAAVPLLIAGAGLASALGAESFAEVVARTVVAISPGSSDDLIRQVITAGNAADEASKRGEVVVILGLGTAFLAATSAFAQLERGANRIYGTERDRPSLRKYGLAMVLTATAGVAMALGLLCIVAGDAFGEAIEQVYHWGAAAETVWDVRAMAAGARRAVIRGDRAVPVRPAAAAARAFLAGGRGRDDRAGVADRFRPARRCTSPLPTTSTTPTGRSPR